MGSCSVRETSVFHDPCRVQVIDGAKQTSVCRSFAFEMREIRSKVLAVEASPVLTTQHTTITFHLNSRRCRFDVRSARVVSMHDGFCAHRAGESSICIIMLAERTIFTN